MIFLTVGTQFPFDRLLKAVDSAVERQFIREDVYAQTAITNYRAKNLKCVPYLDNASFDRYVQQASAVISHAGVGTITIALQYRKPILVVPRLKSCGEVVNDHQMALAKKFDHLGLVIMVQNLQNLPEYLKKLHHFVPQKRQNQTKAVVDRISQFLNTT